MTTIRVLLVDDHAVVRQGLRRLLELEADMEVVGEAENGRQSVDETRKLRPGVILMDVAMPQLNGLEATRQITRAVPSARVLILSSWNDEHFVEEAMQAGAAGYLMKETAAAELCGAIRDVYTGCAFFSPLICGHLLKLWQDRKLPRTTEPLSGLTSRQMEVLQLIAEGYANKQIAGLLALSRKTVEKHRTTLMQKLDCHKIASLTRYAVAHGIVAVNSTPYTTPNWPGRGFPLRQWDK